jgi:hypothetical protein
MRAWRTSVDYAAQRRACVSHAARMPAHAAYPRPVPLGDQMRWLPHDGASYVNVALGIAHALPCYLSFFLADTCSGANVIQMMMIRTLM